MLGRTMVQSLAPRLRRTCDDATRPLTADEMLSLARSVDLEQLDLGEYRGFDTCRYARNTVELNDAYELVVICWLPGQMSTIHDHGESNCLYLVVEGEMTEELYGDAAALDENPEPVRTRKFSRGDVTLAAASDVHRIRADGECHLITVHVYSPPLADVRHFSEL